MPVDVLVIGGGPAGLAAAIAARRKGFRVTVADGQCPPIDKACGECLLPGALEALRELGLDPNEIASAPIRGVRFLGDEVSVGSFFPHGAGAGVRRTALHAALVEEALNCGVELQWNRPVGGLKGLTAAWIIGADGGGSRVRIWAELERFTQNRLRFGFRRHYRTPQPGDHVEIFWTAGAQIYVTPVAADEVGIAVLSRDPKFRVSDAVARFPELANRFREAQPLSAERGSMTASRTLRNVTRGNIALIGDASGSVDAITAEGLSLSFRQALSLADAMERGDLSLYEAAHARLERRPRLMGELMLSMDRWPLVRRRALRALAARPALFSRLIALHVG